MPERCQAETRSGQRCSALAVDGSRCPWHSAAPAWVEKRRQWSVKGGERRSNKQRAAKQLPERMTVAELEGWLSLCFKRTVAGLMDPGVARAAATLATAMLEAAKAGAVEEKLAALEDRSA